MEKLAATKHTCTFRALKEWMRRTEDKAPLEVVEGQTKKVLFFKLSSGIPTPLTSKDVAKFTVEALRKAGVPRVFTAHSVRSAASSAAKDYGVSTAAILAQGRWTNEDTWKHYYYREIPRKVDAPKEGNLQARIRSG